MGGISTEGKSGNVARRLLLGIVTALAVLAALPALALAATVTVNTEADNAAVSSECLDLPGDCSIRQALDKANAGDAVSIPAGHYTLDANKGVLVVTKDITIEGTGAPTVDGGGATGVFSIGQFQGPFPTVSITGLTITGGRDVAGEGGGGIIVYGVLTLTGSTVSDSKAGFGGGIAFRFTEANQPAARIVSSTISGNSADSGGGGIGVGFEGDLVMINSTVSGNTAGSAQTSGQGGGIWVSRNGSARLFNSTIVGNTAVGASSDGGNLFGESGQVAAFAVQRQAPRYTFRNTIVADGTAASGPNCGGGNPTSEGNNLVSDGQCGSVPANGDLSGDAGVASLGNYGGPTFTRKLLAGSKAINAGAAGGCTDDSNAAIAVDQRGVGRPQGGRCDIGAAELAPPLAVTGQPNSVTTSSATITGDVTNPHVAAGTAHFEFGTSTAYGQTFDLGTVAAGASHDPRSMGVTGLSPNTLYHYRIVVSNGEGTSVGEDVTFITGVIITPPGEPEATPHKPMLRAARAPGRCVRTRFSTRISVHVSSGATLRRVDVMLDGKRVRRTTRRRFSVRINTRGLSSGAHVLRVTATDSNGRTTSLRQIFRRCLRKAQPAFTG